ITKYHKLLSQLEIKDEIQYEEVSKDRPVNLEDGELKIEKESDKAVDIQKILEITKEQKPLYPIIQEEINVEEDIVEDIDLQPYTQTKVQVGYLNSFLLNENQMLEQFGKVVVLILSINPH